MVTKQYLAPDASGAAKATTPAVASAADSLVATDSTGKLDPSVMPVGIIAPTQSLPQSGALAAGDFVNIYDAGGGVATVRKADASAGTGKLAHGFVLAATSAPGPATVYAVGDEDTMLTGLNPGSSYYLSDATPGAPTATSPTNAGSAVQFIGVAVSATKIVFEPDTRYVN